jgi:hypothetical protein
MKTKHLFSLNFKFDTRIRRQKLIFTLKIRLRREKLRLNRFGEKTEAKARSIDRHSPRISMYFSLGELVRPK